MGESTGQLIGISYSPWTEKARWALDHHRVSYRYLEHLLLFGMPELRLRTGRWTGPLTVPIFLQGGGREPRVVMDSWEIARAAEVQGQGASIFPEVHLAEIQRYNELSETGANAARVLVSIRVLRDPEAKAEVLPKFIPGPLRGLLDWLVGLCVAYVRKEFGFGEVEEKNAVETLRSFCVELSRALKAAGGEYLVGGKLSYADIAMAVALQGVEPAKLGPRMGPAYRRCWATTSLQSEFKDLLDWRDRLYVKHRRSEKGAV